MPRRNRNAGGRKHDTRMSFKQMSRAIGLNVHQRIAIRRYMIDEMKKGGGQEE